MNLREKMKKGPVFGVTCYTGAPCVVEAIGNWGYDFVYLDLEHCPLEGDSDIEKLILSARNAHVSPLVRTSCIDEIQIRKCLEMGAEGVVVPHCRAKADIDKIIKNAKFPPIGRRGGESNVRSGNFGGPEFSWSDYTQKSNEDTLIIPMDEDYEFTENIQEILDTPCIDAVNFGPIDYALSVGAQVGYKITDSRVKDAYATLAKEAAMRDIGIMAPVVPSSKSDIEAAVKRGITMLILGNDMLYVQNALRSMHDDVEMVRKQFC